MITAHIFQHHWQRYLSSFSTTTGIDNACNSLLLYKPVEWTFDRAKLFVEIIDSVMTFCLIDQELENIKLVDKTIELQAQNGRPGTCSREEAALKITFGDLDGAVLSFPPNCTMRPSKRMLWCMHTHHGYMSMAPLVDTLPLHMISLAMIYLGTKI